MIDVGFLDFNHKPIFQDTYWCVPVPCETSVPWQVSSITVPRKDWFPRVCRCGDIWKASTSPPSMVKKLFSVLSEPGWSQFWPPTLTVLGLVGSMDLLASNKVHTRVDWVRTCILYLLIPLTHISRRIIKLTYHIFFLIVANPQISDRNT